MIVLDANILLYAYDETSPHHETCRTWLESQIGGAKQVALPWITLWAFLRISTNHSLTKTPVDPAVAFALIRELISAPGVVILQPGPRHAAILEKLAIGNQSAGPRLTDAVLAALALENGAELASADHDFARFTDLRWVNPLNFQPLA